MGKIQLGKLEHKISVYRDATQIDATTGEKSIQVQTVKENRWASVKYIGSPSAGSSEEEINEQRTGKIKIEVVCRWFSGLRFEDWLSHDGGRFRIYSIQTLGRNEGYKLRAELRDDDTPMLPTGAILDAGGTAPAAALSPLVSISEVDGLQDELTGADGGYEFTGGFTDRTTGQSGANDLGSNVQYTQAMVNLEQWYRFGIDTTQQAANDVAYFPITDSDVFDQTKGLFGGQHMPAGVSNLFDFEDTSDSAADTTSSLKYTAANGSYDLTECRVGDLIKFRFSFNAVPQVANSTLEVGLIFATRDTDDNVTYRFSLPAQPIFFGTGTQGVSYLNRVEMSAYIASAEDLNARCLPAIRCNNEILIQPLTTLISVIR